MSTTPPVWSKACAIIEQALDAQSFNRWIAPISASFKEDGTLSPAGMGFAKKTRRYIDFRRIVFRPRCRKPTYIVHFCGEVS